MTYKDKAEKLKAFNQYKAKLRLLGVDTSSILGQDEHDDVKLYIKEFAEFMGYPEILKIPDFVDIIYNNRYHGMDDVFIDITNMTDQQIEKHEESERKKNNIRNIKEVYIPDNVKMDDMAYKALRSLPNLERIIYKGKVYEETQ